MKMVKSTNHIGITFTIRPIKRWVVTKLPPYLCICLMYQRRRDSVSRVQVKPRKGDALLFFSLHPNGTIDALNLHGSCPVSLKARNGVRQNGFMSGTLTSPTKQVTIAKMKMSTARHGLRLV